VLADVVNSRLGLVGCAAWLCRRTHGTAAASAAAASTVHSRWATISCAVDDVACGRADLAVTQHNSLLRHMALCGMAHQGQRCMACTSGRSAAGYAAYHACSSATWGT
jgi:hypothetical protein